MFELRFDVAPLPIAELAPVRLESKEPDEPFVLGAGEARVTGYCRLALAALRPASRAGDFTTAAGAGVHAVITPCGVVRTARIGGVRVTERVAPLGADAEVTQWTVDAAAELVPGTAAGTRPATGGDTFRLAAGETATLVRSTGTATGVNLPHDVSHAFRAAAGRLTHAVRAGLQLDTRDATGAALAWAKARLWAHAGATAGIPVPTPAAALAALVAGRPEQTRADMQCVAPAWLPLLAARYAASTGDVQRLGALPLPLRTAAATAGPPDADEIAAIWLAGLAGLERAATDLGDPAYAARLRAAVRRTSAERAARPISGDAAAILTALRTPVPAVPPPGCPAGRDVRRHAWLSWAALEHGQLAAGRAGWERMLAETNVPVRGAVPRRFGTADDDLEATALFVLTLAHGVLGIEPDAPRHRIRIAPRLATAADSLEAHGIPCGDGSLSLSVCIDERAIILRIAQDDGAIPLTAVLEPVVEGAVTAAWVDGRAAVLAVRPHGTGTVVPVQLVLDAERTLRIERARNA